MSTYLELCQRYRLEAGIAGTGPSAVTSNTNTEYARIVNWIADADVEIQELYDDWRFNWAEFSFQTVASDGQYTAADVTGSAVNTIAKFDGSSLSYYLTATGVSAEQAVELMEWPDFFPYWRQGSMRTTTGKPTKLSLRPDGNVELGYVPDAIYTVRGFYWKGPERMDANGDTPRYPSQFHTLPIWWAMVNYAGYEENSALYQHAQNMMNRLLQPMERRERMSSPVRFGDPMA